MDSVSDLKCRQPRRHRLRLCLVVTLTAVILVFVLLLTLALTVFRPRPAVTTINSIKISSLTAGLDLPNLSLDLNLTLILSVTVFNPNAVAFRYPGGGTAEIYYKGGVAGEAFIPPGEITSKGTESMDVALTVLAGRLIGNGEFYRDVVDGELDLTTVTTLGGKVEFLGVVKHHLVSYTTCDVMVNWRNRTVENSDCRYKTKL